MPIIRGAAFGLLRVVVRRCPANSRDWANAMLREMDFIDGDWSALFWAVGGTTAICRHATIHRLRSLASASNLETLARNATSIASGMAGAAVILSVSLLLLSALMRASSLDAHQEQLAQRLFVVGIPEAIYVLSAVALWRGQRRVASGILAAGTILITHAVVHIVTVG